MGRAGGGLRAAGRRWRRSGDDPSSLRDLLPDADRDALANFCPWFAAEREQAPRRGLDVLLERVVDRTGYDLHVLGLPGGRRRWANVLKLQRLAAGFESRRGRDVRGLIDLATAELEAEARETDAPVELGDATAIRLMTMHAAKGLEFPVVVVADLGRSGRNDTDDLLVRDGRVGLRLRTVDGASAKTLDWEALRDEQQTADAGGGAPHPARRDDARRGAADPQRHLRPRQVARRAAARRRAAALAGAAAGRRASRGGSPTHPRRRRRSAIPTPPRRASASPSASTASRRRSSLAHPGADRRRGRGPGRARAGRGRPGGQLALDLFATPEPPPRRVYAQAPPVAPPRGAAAAVPAVRAPIAAPPRPLPATLSYTSLAAYDRCAYRWYLERILRLPRDEQPAGRAMAARRAARGPDPRRPRRRSRAARSPTCCSRSSTSPRPRRRPRRPSARPRG